MGKKAIRCKKLFDARKGEVLRDQVILLAENRITAVEPAARVGALEDFEIIDLSDKFVMPGMIDAHIHTAGNGEPGNLIPRAYQTLGEVALKSLHNVQTDLMAGITSVRCCGDYGYSDIALRDSINSGENWGPRMKVATVAGTTTEHLNPYLKETTYVLPRANGVSELKRAIRYNVKRGSDFIKFSATGSVLGLGSVMDAQHKTYAEMCAIVETAKEMGRTTACHAHGTEGIKNAIRAGTTSIEHGTMLDDEGVELMLQNGTFLVPTLVSGYRAMTEGKSAGMADWALEKEALANQYHHEAFQRAIKGGVKIAFGTDASTACNRHGEQVYEYVLLVEHGMTPIAAMQAGTIHAAELMRMDDMVGVIEPGKLADIVAFENDPTEDITEMTRSCFVMKDGIVYRDGNYRRPDLG